MCLNLFLSNWSSSTIHISYVLVTARSWHILQCFIQKLREAGITSVGSTLHMEEDEVADLLMRAGYSTYKHRLLIFNYARRHIDSPVKFAPPFPESMWWVGMLSLVVVLPEWRPHSTQCSFYMIILTGCYGAPALVFSLLLSNVLLKSQGYPSCNSCGWKYGWPPDVTVKRTIQCGWSFQQIFFDVSKNGWVM